MKKLIIVFFVLTCTTIIFAAKYDCYIDGIYYDLDKETMTAMVTNKTGNEKARCYSSSVVIPSSITYNNETYSVTSIKGYAFAECKGLTSVTIPNSVTTIGGYAFYGCSGLSDVTIPNSVTTIATLAFCGCFKLTLITIPNSVTQIGTYAFSSCHLTSIEIPNSVKTIGKEAFYNCRYLTSVTILNPSIKMAEDVFLGCTITDFYCGTSVDLSHIRSIIKNVHRLSEEELASFYPFEEYARKYVESRINRWQKKGDYEKTADWEARVNERTRKQKVNEYVKEAEKKYLAGYAKRQRFKFTLGQYDPDNEVFLVKENQWGDLLVSVPIADAQYVGKNWSSCTTTPHYVFAETEVVLQSVDFTFPNKKTYIYKPNQQLTYSTPDIKYNFNPIELPDLQTVTMGSGGAVQTPQVPQGITELVVTTPFDLTPMSSVLVSYKNIFGKYEMPDKDETFPYVVIRVTLTGDSKLVRLAKQSLSLDLGQSYITEQTVPIEDKILFLVPIGVKSIYLTDGNGQRQLIYSGRLIPNTIYDGVIEVK